MIRLARRIARPFTTLASRLDFTDVLDIAGVVLLVVCAGMVFLPAAFGVAGALLLAMSYNATRPARRRREDDDA